jgi:MFS family permease
MPVNQAVTARRAGGAHLTVLAVGVGFVIANLDATIVNVATATIQRDLGMAVSGVAWVVNADVLAVARGLLLAGDLAARFGPRRVFFWINLPLGALAIALGVRALPAAGADPTRPVPLIGHAAVAATLAALAVGLMQGPASGWTGAPTLWAAAALVVCGALAWLWQRRSRRRSCPASCCVTGRSPPPTPSDSCSTSACTAPFSRSPCSSKPFAGRRRPRPACSCCR